MTDTREFERTLRELAVVIADCTDAIAEGKLRDVYNDLLQGWADMYDEDNDIVRWNNYHFQ